MNRRADSLRIIATRLRLRPLRQIIRQPGISEAFQLTIQYHDGRYPNQVATLTRAHTNAIVLEVVYRQGDGPPVCRYEFALERFRAFDRALRRLGFDSLDDQPDMPIAGVDLWLMERASGSYARDVVLAPTSASGPYAALWEACLLHMREAIQTISLT